MNPITLPPFARDFLFRGYPCRHCQRKLGEPDVTLVGAGRSAAGEVCFGFNLLCPNCGAKFTVRYSRQRFSTKEWWRELVVWADTLAPGWANFNGVTIANAARDLPKIGPAIMGPYPLTRLWIRGGYKGDVGPIMLIFEEDEENPGIGVLRVEKNSCVTLFDHGERDCIPRLELPEFASLPDGIGFPQDGNTWVKMSTQEIEDIIRDRVFNCMGEDAAPIKSVTTGKKKSRSAHGSTNAKKSRKRTRRPPHDPRPLDS